MGARYDAFALDLSSYSGQRVQTREIEFWTTDGAQKMRAVSHVYTPEVAADLRERARAIAKKYNKREVRPMIDVAQMTLDQVLSEIEAEALSVGDLPDGDDDTLES